MEFVTGRLVALQVNGLERLDLEKRYDVARHPTLLVLDAEGTPYGRIAGVTAPETFLEKVRGLVDGVPGLRERLRAVKERPEDARARLELGLAYLDVACGAEGKPHLEKAAELDPEGKQGAGVRARAELGLLAAQAGDYVRGEALLARARALDPGARDAHVPELLYWLGNCQWAIDKRREALGTMEGLARDYPDSPFGKKAAAYAPKMRAKLGAELPPGPAPESAPGGGSPPDGRGR
ncbi:MAG: hypothetical protein HYZ53_14160 [Planctomycetes bacterium]|nr:hypothetical protein [Planctomycetota bacterium]